MKFKLLAAAAATALLGTVAGATTINFDTDVQRNPSPGVGNGVPVTGPIVYAADGVTVEASGWRLGTGGSNGIRGETLERVLIAQYGSSSGFGGLGVCSAYRDDRNTGNCNDFGDAPRDRHLVDGRRSVGSANDNEEDFNSARSEGVFLAFDHLVRVTEVTFSYWDTSDEFDFHIYASDATPGLDPTFLQTSLGFNTSPTSAGQTRSFDLTTLLTENEGQYFSFAAYDGNDEWKLKAVSFEKVPPVTIDSVPLPAAGWMLLAGVAGLGAIRRRRAKS